MAKIIKFPLKMADGTSVRTLEDLKEHHDLPTIMKYYRDGKLQRWLKSDYNDDVIEELQDAKVESIKKIFSILDLPEPSQSELDKYLQNDIPSEVETNELVCKIKDYVQDGSVLENWKLNQYQTEDPSKFLIEFENEELETSASCIFKNDENYEKNISEFLKKVDQLHKKNVTLSEIEDDKTFKENLKPYLPKDYDLFSFEISQGEIDENGKCKIEVKIENILRVFEIKNENIYATVTNLILKEFKKEDLYFYHNIIINKDKRVKFGKYDWDVLHIDEYNKSILLLCSDKVAVRQFIDSDKKSLLDWLNSDFAIEAFPSTHERKRILQHSLALLGLIGKVFLLTYQQLGEYKQRRVHDYEFWCGDHFTKTGKVAYCSPDASGIMFDEPTKEKAVIPAIWISYKDISF